MSSLKIPKQGLFDQTTSVLYEKLDLLKKEYFNLRFQQTVGDLKNTSRFRIVKKDIARIKTELSKRLAGE